MARQEKKATKNAPEKPQRIDIIRKLMANGQWVTGATVYELADKWQLNIKTVKADSAEASRRLREAIQGDDGIRAMALSALQSIVAESRKRKRNRDAIEAIKVMMGFPEMQAPKEDDEGAGPQEFRVTWQLADSDPKPGPDQAAEPSGTPPVPGEGSQ